MVAYMMELGMFHRVNFHLFDRRSYKKIMRDCMCNMRKRNCASRRNVYTKEETYCILEDSVTIVPAGGKFTDQ